MVGGVGRGGGARHPCDGQECVCSCCKCEGNTVIITVADVTVADVRVADVAVMVVTATLAGHNRQIRIWGRASHVKM